MSIRAFKVQYALIKGDELFNRAGIIRSDEFKEGMEYDYIAKCIFQLEKVPCIFLRFAQEVKDDAT